MGPFAFLSFHKSNHISTDPSKTIKPSSSKKNKSKSKEIKPPSTRTLKCPESTPTSVKTIKISKNEDIIADYMRLWNRHASVEELISFFASPGTKIVFEDDMVMPAAEMFSEIHKCFMGFEDLCLNYESIKEVKPGVVMVEELVVKGTHTQDYGFANFPVIPATGKHVILDAERLLFTMKDGKIQRKRVIALGNLTGPPGMYSLVGGRMEIPPPTDG